MRKYLTIGELADILKINTSTIRHYEREGLISPTKIDKNNYRLYDFDKLDRIENILLLRDLDISLKDLRELLENYSLEQYNNLLKKSRDNIEKKISILNAKKQAVNKKLEYTANIKVTKPNFNIKEYSNRNLIKIHYGQLINISIKEMYDIMKKKPWFDYSKVDVAYMLPADGDNFEYCIEKNLFPEAKDLCETVIIPAGKYLTYGFFVEIDKDIIQKEDIIAAEDKLIEDLSKKFKKYVVAKGLATMGPMIYKQMTKSSHFKLYSFHITIEALIQ